MLAGGLSAVLLATGYPIPPHAATQAMAVEPNAAGAEIRLGARAVGIEAGPSLRLERRDASWQAAPSWSPPAHGARSSWIRPAHGGRSAPTYGVTVQVALAPTPRSVLEEGAVHTVNRPVAEDEPADGPFTFSMVTAGGVSTVGSTFLPLAPDPGPLPPARGPRGAVRAGAGGCGHRAQPRLRPAAVDRRTPVHRPGRGGMDGVYVTAGHGPWGISTGPGSAAMVGKPSWTRAKCAARGPPERMGPKVRLDCGSPASGSVNHRSGRWGPGRPIRAAHAAQFLIRRWLGQPRQPH